MTFYGSYFFLGMKVNTAMEVLLNAREKGKNELKKRFLTPPFYRDGR